MSRHQDVVVVGWTVALEAQDQSQEGRTAVAWVIKNRMRQRAQSAQRVCFGNQQFSCWNNLDGASRRIDLTPAAVMQECMVIAELVLDDKIPDPTSGATYYLNIALTKKIRGDGTLPLWVYRLNETVTIGDHTFYAE